MVGKKKWYMVVGSGFVLGVLLVIIGETLDLPDGVLLRAMLLSYLVFMIITMGYNLFIVSRFNKRMKKLSLQLLEQKDTVGFLKKVAILLEETKDEGLRQVVLMNQSVGYSYAGEYEKANAILEELNKNGIIKPNLGIYYSNLAQNYFMNGEVGIGCHIMEQSRELMEAMLKVPTATSSVSVCFALWRFVMEDKQGGFDYLSKSIQSALYPCEVQLGKMLWAKELWKKKETKEEGIFILQELAEEDTMPQVKKEVHLLLMQQVEQVLFLEDKDSLSKKDMIE